MQIFSETCDDGNLISGDGCSSSCTIETNYVCNTTPNPNVCYKCGNNILQYLEECDDGNNVSGDGCSATCMLESKTYCNAGATSCAVCGNGNRKTGAVYNEACDDGNLISGDGCSFDCKNIETGYTCTTAVPNVCKPICGDGLKVGNEVCDSGALNKSLGIGCNPTCSGSVLGWSCTGGSNITSTVCNGICGDGYRVADEICDDGN